MRSNISDENRTEKIKARLQMIKHQHQYRHGHQNEKIHYFYQVWRLDGLERTRLKQQQKKTRFGSIKNLDDDNNDWINHLDYYYYYYWPFLCII